MDLQLSDLAEPDEVRGFQVEHVGFVLYVPPGHDSWAVGYDPYISLRIVGTESYASARSTTAAGQ